MSSAQARQSTDDLASDAHDEAPAPSAAPLESGIPPGGRYRRDLTETVDLALAENARVEANLNSLIRGLNTLAAGARALRESQLVLREEFENAHNALSTEEHPERSMVERVHQLEAALERAREQAANERRALMEEHDAFLSELLEEHAREKADLTRQLAELKSRLAEPSALQGSTALPYLRASRPSFESTPCMEVHWEELESDPGAASAVIPPPLPATMPGLAGLPLTQGEREPLAVEVSPPSPRRAGPPKLPDSA